MKTKITATIIFFFSALFLTATCFSQTSLKGKIVDSLTNQPLIGAIVFISDINAGTTSDSVGEYQLTNLPTGSFVVTVSYLGFITRSQLLKLSKNEVINFALPETVIESKEAIVTGVSKAMEAQRSPLSIVLIGPATLLQTTATNIVDALAHQAGISQITTGGSISKPVIRGLGYNRVVIVNDGIRQEGQQWGDEHGLEIDEQSVGKVEVLKGPASLSYGADAMAGVINFIDNPMVPDGTIQGKVNSNYQTNNGLSSIGGNAAMNKNHIIGSLSGSLKTAHAYQNKLDGYVFNSGFNEKTLKAGVGIHKSWGYSRLSYSYYELQPGLVEGTRDSATGKFTKVYALANSTMRESIVSDKELSAYAVTIPNQLIQHQKLINTNLFYFKNSSLKLIVAAQQNRRQEFTNVFFPGLSPLHFLLRSTHLELNYNYEKIKDWVISMGISLMHQSSKNLGKEYLVPAYQLTDAGAYLMAHRNFAKLDLLGGIRYDQRAMKVEGLYTNSKGNFFTAKQVGMTTVFDAVNPLFRGVSGGLGAAYQISKKYLVKLNIAKGYRPPNIAELSSNGVHEGTFKYEIGNANLKPESSWEIDAAAAMHRSHVSIELDLFNNRINQFIFARQLNSSIGQDSMRDGFNVFQFQATPVNLNGGELQIDIHPHPWDWLHFENAISYVNARQLKATADSTKYLPSIPATKINTTVRIDFTKTGTYLKNTYVKIEFENVFAQNNVYSAYHTETKTPGYQLLNLGMGGSICNTKKQEIATVVLAITNCTNQVYQSHLSRLKYASMNEATNQRGVFNMGRNFSIKLVIPLNTKLK